MTTFEAAPRAASHGVSAGFNGNKGSTSPQVSSLSSPNTHTGRSPALFANPPRPTTAVNNGVLPSKQLSSNGVNSKFAPTWSEGTRPSAASKNEDASANTEANASVRNRPCKDSIGPMRRKVSDAGVTATSAGGYGIAFANRGQPIPLNRGASRGLSTSPRMGADASSNGPGSFSTSLGSAAEALSLPASVLNSGAKSGRPTGHTHFGQECYGPEPGETIPNPPSNLSKNAPGATPASMPNGNGLTDSLSAAAAKAGRRGSVSESVNGDDDSTGNSGGRTANGKELPVHRCESCNKIYRHPSCLIKHRWEHTVYWKEASKFLMSKHQQVQLLEAAAILVNLDGDTASLPDEKALWPAAVSPASSGLLGSERVNFDKLMQRKVAMRGTRRPSDASTIMSPTSSVRELSVDQDSSALNSSLPRSASAGLSPLNSFTKLGLGSTPSSRPSATSHSRSYSSIPFSYSSRATSDIQHLALDESDERSTRDGEDDDDDDDQDGEERSSGRNTSISAESPEDYEDSADGKNGDKKWGLHEDAVAEMDMDE